MDFTGKYTETPFSSDRELVVDVVELGLAKHNIKGSVEIDVTLARDYIKKYREKTGNRISFTGWIAKCIGHTVNENKQIHALRKGKKKVIIFEDIDILITVEKIKDGQKLPLPYVIRKANEKSLLEISGEIRNAQDLRVDSDTTVIGSSDKWLKLYRSVPGPFRKFIRNKITKDPFLIKRNTGTVGISSVGMAGNFRGWILPISPLPLQFAIGGITKKPGVIDDHIEIREYLSVSFLFDHDIVDGAAVARFLERLIFLMENAFELTSLN